MKPNFLVIGAPKAATTTVCALLSEHPEVYMLPQKGTQFFNRRYDFGWDWYEGLFSGAGDAKAIGEGSPSYAVATGDPPTAQRIAKHLPDVRLIYIVRHPVERLESHYVQQIDNGQQFKSLSDAVYNSPALVAASRYWARISDYRQAFPDEQILVLFFEDFKKDPQETLRRCFEFLDVDPTFAVSDPKSAKNTRADKRTDRPLLRWVRRHESYVKLQWALPRWFVETLKPLLRRPIKIDVTWDEPTRLWVIEQVADDARQFLEFYQKPPDYWVLD